MDNVDFLVPVPERVSTVGLFCGFGQHPILRGAFY